MEAILRYLDKEVEMPSPVGNGWKLSENNELEINWCSQPPETEHVLEILVCHFCWHAKPVPLPSE